MREYRQTYIRDTLELRSKILILIRSFFEKQHFLEVETPIRIPAPAPEANINAQESGDWFLHTSPELCMKRLLAAGYSRIFQICKCFRRGERGVYHLPEMTILEWYETASDYKQMMSRCEFLLKYIALQLGFENSIYYKGRMIDFSGSWDRVTVTEAFDRYASMDIETALLSDCFDEVMCLEIEPQLGNQKPVFLYDYPSSLSALSKISPENPLVAERFEMYCGGLELCNAFTELTDPSEQRYRFQTELDQRKQDFMQIYPMPEPFLDALADMPPASGNAMGIDRLVMLFADAQTIDHVVSFVPEEL